MPKAIKPQRGLFLCLALAVGLLGCQPTTTTGIDPDDPGASTSTIKRTPRPTATYTSEPEATLEPGATPTPTPTPTPNPLGIRAVYFDMDGLTSAEGGDVRGPSSQNPPLFNYCLYLKPTDENEWPGNLVYMNYSTMQRALYPTVLRQAYLAKVEMDNTDDPGATELTLTLPNGQAGTLAADQTYRLGTDAPFTNLSGCSTLQGVAVTTRTATESVTVGQTRNNGIRFLVSTENATADTPVYLELKFQATSAKARDHNATDVQPVTRSLFIINSGDLPVVIE